MADIHDAITFKEVRYILKEINNGKWTPIVGDSGVCRMLNKSGCGYYLWVGSGMFFLKLRSDAGTNHVILPLYMKIYMWNFGIRKIVKAAIKEHNKRLRDDVRKSLKRSLFK